MKIIDPHLHLFNLPDGDYAWLKSDNAPYWPDKKKIHRSFSEQELTLADQNGNEPLSLGGFVHIEAGFDNQHPWREISWLESHCQHPFRSIATIDLTLATPAFEQSLIKLCEYKSVVGGRHILDEQAVELLSNPQVQCNLTCLAKYQLLFELQIPLSNNEAVELMAQTLHNNPSLKVIINHAGSPTFSYPALNFQKENDHTSWLLGLKRLSRFEQCAIKCSGWEMADRKYSLNWVKTVLEACVNHFGKNRVMLASNFPLCLLVNSYQQTWLNNFQLLSNELNLEEKKCEALLYSNASHWYELGKQS